jgi:hypothetical protein
MPRILLAVALIPLLAACGDKDDDSGFPDDDLSCTTEARVSVMVTLEASDGAAIQDATVTYAAAGSDDLPCEAWPEEPAYACGFEVEGEVTVTAVADGFSRVSETVDVPADRCHVETQDLSLVLVPSAPERR